MLDLYLEVKSRKALRSYRNIPSMKSRLAPVVSHRVRVASVAQDVKDSHSELDSHADTCVLGSNVLVIQDFNRPVQVTGYDTTQKSKVFKMVSGVLAFDDPFTGRTHMLVCHQAIHMPQINEEV